MREDGKYIESGENYNVVVQKLINDDRALGIMGYSYYEENTGSIQASPVDGVMPDVHSIESGSYGISRRLYVYVKKEHIGAVPGIVEFLRELTSETAMGTDGYMTTKGLLPQGDAERKAARASVEKL